MNYWPEVYHPQNLGQQTKKSTVWQIKHIQNPKTQRKIQPIKYSNKNRIKNNKHCNITIKINKKINQIIIQITHFNQSPKKCIIVKITNQIFSHFTIKKIKTYQYQNNSNNIQLFINLNKDQFINILLSKSANPKTIKNIPKKTKI